MLLEHLIYSTAIAIIAGMIYYKYTRRDPSWIIIASAYAPDLDIIAGEVFKKLDINVLINDAPIKHGDFHNIAVLLIFAVSIGLLLKPLGKKFIDSFMFAGIGFGAHMFEDALVFNPGYAFFWPLLSQKFGIGIVEYKPDWYGIANTEVLIVGLIAVISALGIRALYEGKAGLKRSVKAFGVAAAIMILMMPIFGLLDVDIVDKVSSTGDVGFIDKWYFTQNASWDSSVFHSGNHSARIEIPGNVSKISGIWVSDRIRVEPNTTYIFSAWGRTLGAEGYPAVRVVERDVNDTGILQTNLGFGRGTSNWTNKNITFKTHTNTYYVIIYANIWKGYGTFWFDDVELYEEGTNNNLVPNCGFENDVDQYPIPGIIAKILRFASGKDIIK